MTDKAHKPQTKGLKGNRNFYKEPLIGTKSGVKPKVKSVIDPRMTKVNILISHPRRCGFNTSIESYKLEKEIERWQKDGYSVLVIN